jgi:hypothetical protein
LKFLFLVGFVNKVHNFGIAFDKWNCWPIEEGRAASKSHHEKVGYFLSVSQQAVSADINKKTTVGKIVNKLFSVLERS